MSETTFTFRVDSELKERFSELAREHDRPGSQLLRDFMRSFVAQRSDGAASYESWFRQQVQSALNDSAPAVPSKTVEQHFAKRRMAARRKAARKR